MTIAFIGFGEAGGILAADLAREHAVTMWDCKLNGPEREAMGKKARDSRVQVGNSLAQALEGATLVFSTVTAGAKGGAAGGRAAAAGTIFPRSQLRGAGDETAGG